MQFREPNTLNSWKEIAAYLGRGVRTVQRWERDLGLPVHRRNDGLRSPVFATTVELDQWMRRSTGRRGMGAPAAIRSEVFQKAATLTRNVERMSERMQRLSHTIRRTVDCRSQHITSRKTLD
jgi:hypothetical protein